mgnify:CR=1 FL=1
MRIHGVTVEGHSPVEEMALTMRFNLDGNNPGPRGSGESLQVVAKATGLTREQIRKIERPFLYPEYFLTAH